MKRSPARPNMTFRSTSTTTKTVKQLLVSSTIKTPSSSITSSFVTSTTTPTSSISTVYTTQFLNAPTTDVNKGTTPSRDLGISVGIPICLFLLGILFCGAFIYFKKRENNNDKEFNTESRQAVNNPFGDQLPWTAQRKSDREGDLEQLGFTTDPWGFEKREVVPVSPTRTTKSKGNVFRKIIGPHILTPIPADTQSIKTPKLKSTSSFFNPYMYGTSIKPDTDFTSGSYTTRQILEVDDSASPEGRSKSPLSKWFLSSLADRQNGSKTPNKRWKNIGVLSKVDKQYFNYSGEFQCDERSPILEVRDDSSQTANTTNTANISMKNDLFVANNNVTQSTNFETEILARSKFGDRCDSLDIGSKFRPVLQEATDAEKLTNPFKINRLIKPGVLCTVIREYTPQLTDEINVERGDHVRILATHSDTWCLVEKCKSNGDSISEGSPIIGENFKKLRYLNSNRGIIPGKCLAPVC